MGTSAPKRMRLRGRGVDATLNRDIVRLQRADGYIAIDALIALMIFATTITFALPAIRTANELAQASVEARRSNQLLQLLLANAPTTPNTEEGANRGFSWRVVIHEPVLSAGASALCRQDATVKVLRSGRSYALSTARSCPASATS